MIPDHLIDQAARALIRGRGRDPGDTGNLPELTGALHDAAVILEAVAADIWEQGAEHGALAPGYDPDDNPYRASEEK